MPTRCNRGFYCRSYFLLNIFRAPLCPSSGAQEYYTVVAACDISCCGFQVAGLVWSWGLCVRFAGCFLVYQQASCKSDSSIYFEAAAWYHIAHILKLNQQDATLYNIRLLLSVLYMFRADLSLIIRSSKTVHAASGTCQTCLMWQLAWSPTLPS